ncbi:MAG: hypothetical protein GY796_19485 [Chloroflexi bacterium]|nr:hypothetical protein [Chloroflexota bacterium]
MILPVLKKPPANSRNGINSGSLFSGIGLNCKCSATINAQTGDKDTAVMPIPVSATEISIPTAVSGYTATYSNRLIPF